MITRLFIKQVRDFHQSFEAAVTRIHLIQIFVKFKFSNIQKNIYLNHTALLPGC